MPLSSWTSVRLAAALCALPLSARADAPRPVLHDATVVTDATLVRGAEATVFVSVAGATGLTESAPIAGATVEVSLVPVDEPRAGVTRTATPIGPRLAAPAPVGQARTGADGSAVIGFRVPRVDPGRYRMVVRTRSRHGAGVVERAIEVADRLHLHLRTDRQVYRAGQTILWRVTAVGGADAHPAAGDEIELVVSDPRNTAIWRGRQAIPASGMIAGEIPLGDDLLHGGYTLTARVRDAEASERVEVREFRLPVYEIAMRRVGERPVDPGGSIEVAVTARYRYGEPVAGGEVQLTVDGEAPSDDPGDARARAVDEWRAGSDGRRAKGRLDASGTFQGTLRVSYGAAGAAMVRASVTDGAGRRERATLSVPLRTEDDLHLALVPDRLTAVRGALEWFTAVTTDGRGHLAPARVTVSADRGRRLAFDSPGALRVALRAPEGTAWSVKASAVASGDVAEAAVSMELGQGPLLQLRDAVVEGGRPVIVTGRWERPTGPVLATLLRDGAPIASTIARIDRGTLRAELRPPVGSFGLATVRLVEIGWSPDHAVNRECEHLNVYLRPARLDVSLAATTRHRPGERTAVDVAVRDAAGRPVAGAALAASVVDERVLALGREGPELVAALQQLDSVQDATSLGLTFADLLDGRQGDEDEPLDPAAAAAAMRAILAALPATQHTPELVVPAQERWAAESARMVRARPLVVERLIGGRGAIGHRARGGAYVYDRELWQVLADLRWTAAERATPWSEPTTWSYATRLDPTLAFDTVAGEVATARLQRLADALAARGERARRRLAADGSAGLAALIGSGDISSGFDRDPWGSLIAVDRVGGPLHPFQPHEQIDLVSPGPDRTLGTGDDLRQEDVFALGGGFGYGSIGAGGSGAGVGYGQASALGSVRMGAAREAPTLRRRFDETVLWRVGVPTDARGRARLEVPLADGVTGWRVAVEALSATGAVGAAQTRLETFLPLHLDAELPPRLAVGDRYRIPIAVANHSSVARRLSITAELGGSLRRADRAPLALELAAGGTGVVHVEAVASAAGTGRVRLDLVADGQPVDRVERTLPVDPPGELVRSLVAGDVLDGRGRLGVDVPAGIAPGSLRGRLRLYRGAADLAVEGLQGMLQEPYGCFEQTSSTTYPNLLVLRLLRGQPRMAAVRARARDLVGRGYQRLISYEVAGGGFSWFGESPANQVLTAYGLTEFVDMAEVYPVDPALIQRTRTWLIGKQQRDGSWRPDAAFLHDWSQVQGQVATTAFIAWSLAEAGTRGAPLERALGFLRGRRETLARDPYLLALWAAAEGAAHGARNPALAALIAAGRQEGAGLAFRTGGRTIFHARGEAADVQLTSLAVTALARAGRDAEARRALDWLWQARSDNYGWGTTQGTVLALRAAALAMPPPPSETGALRVAVDGRAAGTIDLASVDIPSLALDRLGSGKHQLSIQGDGDARGLLRADLRLSWREPGAPRASAAGLAVDLTTPAAVPLGQAASFSAVVANRTRAAVAMPTVLLPVPPGLTVAPASLNALRRTAGVSKVEDLGDQLAVYLLDLAPDRSIALTYRLDAGARCDVLVRPASAYAFYTPEVRGRSSSRRLRVTASGSPTAAGAPTPSATVTAATRPGGRASAIPAAP